MRYLVSYDASQGPKDRLGKELADLRAYPFHRWAWTLETTLTTAQLLQHLNRFLKDADGLVVVDVTGREVGVAHGPDRTLLAETGTRQGDPGAITQTSLAAASLVAAEPPAGAAAPAPAEPSLAAEVPLEAAAPAPEEPSLDGEAPLAAEPGDPTSGH